MESTEYDDGKDEKGLPFRSLAKQGLLEVEEEAGQADEDAKDSDDRLDRKSHVLSPLFWHLPVDAWLGGGGCCEDFRPQSEIRAERANPQCAMLHTHMLYL